MKATIQIVSFMILSCISTSCWWRCANLECALPPVAEVSFEFKNSQGENLIASGQLTLDDISFMLKPTQEALPLSIYENKVIAEFRHNELEYTLTVESTSFEIQARVEEVDDGDCCNSFTLKSLFIDGVAVTPSSPGNTVTLVL